MSNNSKLKSSIKTLFTQSASFFDAAGVKIVYKNGMAFGGKNVEVRVESSLPYDLNDYLLFKPMTMGMNKDKIQRKIIYLRNGECR